MCLPISSLPGRRHLRSAVRGQLAVLRYRLTTAGRRAFSFAGPSAWNSLPTYLNDHTTLRFLKSFFVLDIFRCIQRTTDFFFFKLNITIKLKVKQ